MWRSRLRATFLSNRDEVEAGDEPTITHKNGYDIYRLLAVCAFNFSNFNQVFFIVVPISVSNSFFTSALNCLV